MKPVQFHPEALAEGAEAAAYYEGQQPGLGIRFCDALGDAVHRVNSNPLLYRTIGGEVRKCRVPRFPYGIIFRLKTDCIEVIAVMHLHRKPGYWKGRL